MTILSKTTCMRCGGEMKSLGYQQLQKGRHGWIMGSWGNLLSGALEVEMLMCQTCGKMEFYSYHLSRANTPVPEVEAIPMVYCTRCGQDYDPELSECPRCGFVNIAGKLGKPIDQNNQ